MNCKRFEPYIEVKAFVRIMAACDFDCNRDVYSGSDALSRVGAFAHALWLRRSEAAVELDRRLSICENDYVVWCTEEFLNRVRYFDQL